MTIPRNGYVIFFRKGKAYYFKFREKFYKLDCKNMKYLKSNLICPTEIRFCGLSRAQIGRIMSDLVNSGKCYIMGSIKNISKVKQYVFFLYNPDFH